MLESDKSGDKIAAEPLTHSSQWVMGIMLTRTERSKRHGLQNDTFANKTIGKTDNKYRNLDASVIMMKELFDKLSTYNIFNFLLPGILFAVVGGEISSYTFVQQDIVVGAFVYYFIGLVVSRVGSVIVEPIFKALGIIKFEPYPTSLKQAKKMKSSKYSTRTTTPSARLSR